MKDFTQEQITGYVAYFEAQKFPLRRAVVGGREFNFYVLPPKLETKLPNFAFRMTGLDEKTGKTSGIFGTSSSVRIASRPFWALHEFVEFMELGIGHKGRCSEAEEIVLDLIPDDLKPGFIRRRELFFKRLIPYFQFSIERNQNLYTPDDVEEAKGTLRLLLSYQ